MITTAFILIKALFITVILRLYKRIKENSLTINNLDFTISETKQKLKFCYLLSFIILALGITGKMSIKYFLDSKPYEVIVIGTWNCSNRIDEITFFDNYYFEIDNESNGTWEIIDSLMTLSFESENQDLEILELTSDKLKIFYRPDYLTINCKK